MEKIEPIKAFIGKTVIIRYNLPTGQIFRYEGIVLDITDTSIILDDFKEGQMMLPLTQCQVKEVKNG
jgi:hypothetical protein